jgi:hypothetical protein
MLSSPIGRVRFFFYSVAISIAELIGVAVCISATMGFDRFIHSKPGSSRESLALASFVVMMLFVVARANITWRRGNDADLSKWLVVPYIAFLPLFAVLQAVMLLIFDFKTGNTNIGFDILSTGLLVWWFRICLASPQERSFDPDSFLTAEGFGDAPSARFGHARTASVPVKPSMVSTPVTVSAGGHGNASVGFGRRGRS